MNEVDILLIEDNIADADFTLRALKQKDNSLKILHVEDGAEALDFIFCEGSYSNLERNRYPKIILMDLQLPKVSGIEVLRRIKGTKITQLLPVVILTSSNHQADVLDCYQLGANAYMVKSLDFKQYVQQISTMVSFWMDVNYLPNF